MSFVAEFNELPLDALVSLSGRASAGMVRETLARTSGLGLADFARLISPAAGEQLEALSQRSQAITRQRFGRVIRLFAPLYLSNECINNCQYCGFSRDNAILRVTLSVDEVLREARALAADGFRNILLVAGEHPKFVSNGYMAEVVRALHAEVPSISLEVGPMETADYRPMVEFCKANHMSLVAANPPRRYVNMVSRKGPDSLLKLGKESRTFLPKLPYSTEIPKGYDESLDKVFDAPHASSTAQTMPGMPSVQNLKYSQMLWDTGMADSIATFIRKHRGTRVLQMNGSMHSDFRFGIVDRLKRQSRGLKVLTITIKPEAGYPDKLSDAAAPGAADFVIVTPVK